MTASLVFSLIRKRPLLFNGVTGCVLCASSDALAQELEHFRTEQQKSSNPKSSSSLDWVRVASAGVIGAFFGGLVYPLAYAKLDAVWVGNQLTTVIKKSVVEIATVGIFVNSISMTSRGLLRGDHSTTDVVQHVAQELPTVTRNDCLVWLPYNLLAFSMIPAVIRPTTTALMEASWQTYISLRSHDFSADDASPSPQPNSDTIHTK